MGDKLFLKGGPNLRPFPIIFLTNFIPALIVDHIGLTAVGRIFRIFSNPLSFTLPYFFKLFRPVEFNLLNLGYVWTFDFVRKVNVNGHVYLLPVSDGLIGYHRIPPEGNDNSRYLTIFAVVQAACCLFSIDGFVAMV